MTHRKFTVLTGGLEPVTGPRPNHPAADRFITTVTETGCFRARGPIDAETAPLLVAALGNHRPVLLDLEECTFVDSTALSVFLAIRGDVRSNLVIINAPPALVRLLEITHLADHFERRPRR